MVLIYLLIAFFVCLFIYQLILAFYPNSIEGMENKDTNTELRYTDYAKDPLILGEQNAGNIEYLKGQFNRLSTDSINIDKLQTNIDALQQQVDDLGQQMTDLSQNMISSTTPDTSAIDGEETTESAEADIAAEDDKKEDDNLDM
jgi:hypothetical protein